MKKKASIQLSISFLVTIIIGIVLLAGGILLLREFIDSTIDIRDQVDEKTARRLYEMIDSGYQVAIPFSQKTIERGSSHVFVIGILNIEDDSDFTVEISFSSGEDKLGNLIDSASIDVSAWFSYLSGPYSISRNDKKTVQVLATVPENIAAGTYIFNVRTAKPDPSDPVRMITYDQIRKIKIYVP